ncbi:hypothetical protein P4O66_002612 [Electrophorus voltai]|uniref:Bestrophin homolog n=1 Tax=Electrophorus voltai TaxID=2609070 RepID=A0AAD8YWT3_9TELE|nr:hypothetical protein P4O66_002612 [Electrophorus voltai]
MLYRFLLDDGQRRLFDKLAIYCDQYAQLIPVSFVLGFYVTLVVSRWWGQFESVPWPDRLAALVGGHVRGVDEGARLIRRSLVRYANLSGILIYRSISTAVYKRFPTMQHLVAEQLINPFGEDDDDFETNWLVDRNLQVSLLSVDEMYDLVPVVERDQYWNETEPQPPYTVASAEHRKPSYMGSALDISVPKEEMEFQPNLEQIKEHEEANHSTPLLGSLSRLLGVQSPSFPCSAPSSRLSLLRRRPRAPLSRFPLYLHLEAPALLAHGQNLPDTDMLECAFSSMSLYERPGCYSCPQTPIHSVPPPIPRPRPLRRGHNQYKLRVHKYLKHNQYQQYQQHRRPLLVGHNIRRFDCLELARALDEFGLKTAFEVGIAGFVDSLPLACQLLKNSGIHSFKQEILVKTILGVSYVAHNALEDVQALQKRYWTLRPTASQIQQHMFSLDSLNTNAVKPGSPTGQGNNEQHLMVQIPDINISSEMCLNMEARNRKPFTYSRQQARNIVIPDDVTLSVTLSLAEMKSTEPLLSTVSERAAAEAAQASP